MEQSDRPYEHTSCHSANVSLHPPGRIMNREDTLITAQLLLNGGINIVNIDKAITSESLEGWVEGNLCFYTGTETGVERLDTTRVDRATENFNLADY